MRFAALHFAAQPLWSAAYSAALLDDQGFPCPIGRTPPYTGSTKPVPTWSLPERTRKTIISETPGD